MGLDPSTGPNCSGVLPLVCVGWGVVGGDPPVMEGGGAAMVVRGFCGLCSVEMVCGYVGISRGDQNLRRPKMVDGFFFFG